MVILNTKFLGNGTVNLNSEEIAVKNVMLFEQTTNASEGDINILRFELELNNKEDYYKLLEFGIFNINFPNRNVPGCVLLDYQDDGEKSNSFTGYIRDI